MPSSKKSMKKETNKNKEEYQKYPKSLFDLSVAYSCSDEDYESLLEQATSLSFEEARDELLECSRYNEIDAVRAILAKHNENTVAVESTKEIRNNAEVSSLMSYSDASGNTALHKSCANGHHDIVALLLHYQAPILTNESGNTPLHWAAANGYDECVYLILHDPVLNGKTNEKNSQKIDVLQKNSFGRSALTEGFSSQNTKVVGLLLEHDSAEEERLIGGTNPTPINESGSADNDPVSVADENMKTKGVVHEFLMSESNSIPDQIRKKEASDMNDNVMKTLLIRELPIAHADDPFGDKPEEDSTGLGIWCASIVMSRWMASSAISSRFDGKSLLELGAGCAIPGLTAALHSNAESICVTDINPKTVLNIEHNIKLNEEKNPSFNPSRNRVKAQTINWDDVSTWPKKKVDYILGSDLIYQSSIVPLLTKVIRGLLSDHGSFFYVAPEGGRDGLEQFINEMKSESKGSDSFFVEVIEKIAPPEYVTNPLKSQDEEDCFLHFHELASTTYILYEFKRN